MNDLEYVKKQQELENRENKLKEREKKITNKEKEIEINSKVDALRDTISKAMRGTL